MLSILNFEAMSDLGGGMMRHTRAIIIAGLIACLTASSPLAGLESAWGAPNGSKANRQKVIDFEDSLIEGMNKRPLDSFAQISERDKKRRKVHRYRKRAGFRTETAETVRDMRYAQ